jgi:hypothetical protein
MVFLNEREMQPKRRDTIKKNSLPCAGITLIRFNGYNLSLLGTPGIGRKGIGEILESFVTF